MGTLYLVATPIGNLEDVTLRALRVLKEVALIAAEDTRTTRKLLTHFGIHTPTVAYFEQPQIKMYGGCEHSRVTRLDQILETLARADVAVVSEAGMPGLSDPGYELVRAALAQNYRVVPIPGASALTSALVACGLPVDQFVYLGFLPRAKNERRRLLESVAEETRTLVMFEAPHRLRAALKDIAEVLGDRQMCVAREMTKMFEEFYRARVSEVVARFAETLPRGEFTLVVEGAREEKARGISEQPQIEMYGGCEPAWDEAKIRAAVRDEMARGVSRTTAVKKIARLAGWDRREVYRLS
jgi:16S rRNA (cytidine1402-2'-O)-methyltransferase